MTNNALRGIARPKIDDKYHFELKGQFLKELRENTFSGSDHEDVNEHIEKVLEIVDIFHVPNITQDQIMLRVFPMSLNGAASRWLRNKPSGLIITWEDLKTKFLSKTLDEMPSTLLDGDAGASVIVMTLSTYLNLGLGELAHTKLKVELVDRTVKYPKGIAENVLVGIELRRDQVDDLMPTIKEGEVIDEPMIDIIKTSYGKYGWLPRLRNGRCHFGEPFCKASCVEERRFDALITIHNGNDSVTYQIARSHPRFIKCPMQQDQAIIKGECT
ncbi:hypothetical protein Tco_1439580 [Tanacetum coccineum]